MKRSDLKLLSAGASEALLPRLRGRVFHVTKLSNRDEILRSGRIDTNLRGGLKSSFGHSQNGFFRKRDAVSLFDYRFRDDDQIRASFGKCSPTQAAVNDTGVAVFILSPDVHSRLLTWEKCKAEWSPTEMIVPYVESGHAGPIDLTSVSDLFSVEIEEDPIVAILRRPLGSP